jgi:hypothetical protein
VSVPLLSRHRGGAGVLGVGVASSTAARLLHPAAATLVTAPLAPDVLRTIAAGLATPLGGDALALSPGRDRSYVRLLATPAYEAWLIAWAPTSALELHDHGGSDGAVHVVHGHLAERYTEPARSPGMHTRSLHAGRGVHIPAGRIHEVWNPSPDLALSVHVYSPPLGAMTFFAPDDHGALVPAREVLADASG